MFFCSYHFSCVSHFIDMQSTIARYFCYAKSICFRDTQTRYDTNPRSRSEHIEFVNISNALAYIENP